MAAQNCSDDWKRRSLHIAPFGKMRFGISPFKVVASAFGLGSLPWSDASIAQDQPRP